MWLGDCPLTSFFPHFPYSFLFFQSKDLSSYLFYLPDSPTYPYPTELLAIYSLLSVYYKPSDRSLKS